jgi:hypothetical protein
MRTHAGHGIADQFPEGARRDLPGIDPQLHGRRTVFRFLVCPSDGHWFSEVVAILNPIEMNVEAGVLSGIQIAFLEKGDESGDRLACDSRRSIPPDVVEVEDHVRVAEKSGHASNSDSSFREN